MPNRVQTIRSNITGNRPTGRLPGELYVNWPDSQIGSINPAGNPQDLIAVRFFSTTAGYVVNDHVIQNGIIYHCTTPSPPGPFIPANWVKYIDTSAMAASLASYLPLTGGTLTGALHGTDATFSGDISGNDATFSGAVIGGGNATFSGAVIGTSFAPDATNFNLGFAGGFISIGTPTANECYIRAMNTTASQNRWVIDLMDGTNETGSNNGADFKIMACSDAGSITSTPIKIKRSTGVVTFSSAIVNGPSDRTLKENIEPLGNSLDTINALQGVKFNFIDTPDKQEIGLIAQDVQPIVPEIVQTYEHTDVASETTEQKLALDYPKLVAHLVEAIKTLTQRVTALEKPPKPMESKNGSSSEAGHSASAPSGPERREEHPRPAKPAPAPRSASRLGSANKHGPARGKHKGTRR